MFYEFYSADIPVKGKILLTGVAEHVSSKAKDVLMCA
jgi:hypothetical protein